MAPVPMLTSASLSFSRLLVRRLGAASFGSPGRAASAVAVRAAAASSKSTATPKKRLTGITVPKSVSPVLQAIVGAPEIKQHNLQDPADKKVMVCDDKLKVLFAGRERVGFLEIAKLLSPHFVK